MRRSIDRVTLVLVALLLPIDGRTRSDRRPSIYFVVFFPEHASERPIELLSFCSCYCPVIRWWSCVRTRSILGVPFRAGLGSMWGGAAGAYGPASTQFVVDLEGGVVIPEGRVGKRQTAHSRQGVRVVQTEHLLLVFYHFLVEFQCGLVIPLLEFLEREILHACHRFRVVRAERQFLMLDDDFAVVVQSVVMILLLLV